MVPTLGDTLAAARNTRASLEQANTKMNAQAMAAGRAAGAAVRTGGNALKRTILARTAFNNRVGAEAEKHKVMFLILAYRARMNALQAMQDAARTREARLKQNLVDRATKQTEKASVLEMAAQQTEEAVKHIPEPESVSIRKAQRIAIATGVPTSDETSISPYAVMNKTLVDPLMTGFFPDDVVRAASSLQGLGEAESGPSFFESLKAALGIGVSAAGEAGLAAGQEAAKGNPAAGAAIAAGGGLLSAIASALGFKFNEGVKQGQDTVAKEEGGIPGWVWPVGIAVVGIGGYLLLRRK